MPARRLRLVLAPDAKSDIRTALIYTEQQWGLAQRRAYRRALDEAFDRLARYPEPGRLRPEYGADARSHVVRQHIVIHRVIGGDLEISRVLHGRRDIESLLSESEP